jgi:rubrerythrin
MNLKGSRTHENLKAAFAGESQANRRYLYFAAKAERSHANRFRNALDSLQD